MTYNLDGLINHWKNIFSSDNPFETLLNLENNDDLRKIIKKKFDLRYLPEPFYGYLDGDTSTDILFLLLNPGQERESELKERFTAPTIEESRRLWNESTQHRHLSWTKQDYLNEEKRIYVSDKWRYDRLVSALSVLGEYDGNYVPPDRCFLHTAEFFPFRSKTFDVTNNWIFELQSTRYLLGALRDISLHNKVRFIFGVSKSWFDILDCSNGIFEPMREIRVTLKKKSSDPNSDTYSHRMALYRLEKDATPILIFKAWGSSRMNLPVNKTAVKIIRYMLDVPGGELPIEDEDFLITVD
jgi:hypothetical protein